MSMPKFPDIEPPIEAADALNMILESIAKEELALSHIIDAEGEKLQYILGTLPGGGKDGKATPEEIVAINKSVKCLLDSVLGNQLLLKGKMDSVICAMGKCPPLPGPTGPTGACSYPRALVGLCRFLPSATLFLQGKRRNHIVHNRALA